MVHKVGPGGPEAGGKVVEVGIWSDMCEAVDQGDAAASWLGAFLGMVSELNDQEGIVRNGKVIFGICMASSFLEPVSHERMGGTCASREHTRETHSTHGNIKTGKVPVKR